jgi:autotransporter-associated beta strand protein
VPGSTVNGPQPTHCAIASCDPAVMLGLTPALLAQFTPANTQAATPTTPGYTFPNTGIQGWATFPTNLTVTVKGQSQVVFTQRSLLDSGTPNNQLFEFGFPSGGVAVPRGATVTISDGVADSATTSFISSPTPFGSYPYPNDPYGVSVSNPGRNPPSAFLGVGFFLQNSVLFDLAGDAIGWTPNYVTAANIATTPQAPLTIGSDSVPLGLAGVISGDGGVAITPGGSATLSGTNTYTGATTITGGYLALVGPGSISTSSSVNVSAYGLFDISGVTLPGGVVIQSLSGDSNGMVWLGANTLVLPNASGSYAGILVGSGGLTLNGGVDALSGIDAYGGATAVNGGFLVINGVLAGTSNVTVNAGGALGGDGIIDPPVVTIASGGTLAPGKPGVAGSGMMIIVDLAMQPGSTFMSLVGAGGASFASVSGTATLAGTATAAFAGGSLAKSCTILSSSGLNGTFDNFTTVNLPQSLSAGISYDSNNVYLNFTSHMASILGLTATQHAIASNLDSYSIVVAPCRRHSTRSMR